MIAERALVPRLAFRNVLRNRRRSLLSGSVIFFGVFFLVFARGFIDGIEYGSERTQIDTNCAHLRVVAAGAVDDGFDLPLTPRIGDARPILLRAAELPGAVAATPRIRFSADGSDGRGQLRVVAIGIDTARDAVVFPMGIDAATLEGDPPGAMVGAGILKLFEIVPGDVLTLVARTPEGSISALDFVVRGAISTGNPAVDNLHVIVPIASARELLALGESEATEVAVRLDGQRATARAASAMRSGLAPQLSIETWVEATEDIRSLMAIRRKALAIIVFVIMAIAAAGIANTVLMSIYERFREIGTVTAFGFPPASVRRLFLLEGITLGAMGSVAGMIAGSIVVLYFERHGIDITSLTQAPDVVYPISAVIYTEFDALGVLEAGAFGVLVAAVATVLPARRAARLDPVEALRS